MSDIHYRIPTIADAPAIAQLHVACWREAALGARFVRPDTYQWHGHDLPESLYVFDDLAVLTRAA